QGEREGGGLTTEGAARAGGPRGRSGTGACGGRLIAGRRCTDEPERRDRACTARAPARHRRHPKSHFPHGLLGAPSRKLTAVPGRAVRKLTAVPGRAVRKLTGGPSTRCATFITDAGYARGRRRAVRAGAPVTGVAMNLNDRRVRHHISPGLMRFVRYSPWFPADALG